MVLIGQDPYINIGQAEGYSFSVPEGQPIPPSLRNIFKVLGLEKRSHGCLQNWVEQGVMLLNISLSVRQGKQSGGNCASCILGSSNSHARLWQPFSTRLMAFMAEHSKDKVYLLWGKEARRFAPLFVKFNMVLEACHPSPMNGNGFQVEARHHFTKANEYIVSKNLSPIKWE